MPPLRSEWASVTTQLFYQKCLNVLDEMWEPSQEDMRELRKKGAFGAGLHIA
jgi:hypothetical protein